MYACDLASQSTLTSPGLPVHSDLTQRPSHAQQVKADKVSERDAELAHDDAQNLAGGHDEAAVWSRCGARSLPPAHTRMHRVRHPNHRHHPASQARCGQGVVVAHDYVVLAPGARRLGLRWRRQPRDRGVSSSLVTEVSLSAEYLRWRRQPRGGRGQLDEDGARSGEDCVEGLPTLWRHDQGGGLHHTLGSGGLFHWVRWPFLSPTLGSGGLFSW